MLAQKDLYLFPDFYNAKPILKWAGGKTQLLNDLSLIIPKKYNTYIEPFFGGGALFFHLKPKNAIIADSNPELINLYKSVANNVQDVIECLRYYENTVDFFYKTRSQNWLELNPAEAAARTIYLNKTCFNGLYRVNKKGGFNVPFGKYKNPNICDKNNLINASLILKDAKILCMDYKEILDKHANKGDLIFLDPPYLPTSIYSDFKRYTKEQFYEKDHIELYKEVLKLHDLGCHTILTNSNHPLVHEQYKEFSIKVIQTKRFISSKANTRTGEDLIIDIPPKIRTSFRVVSEPLSKQVDLYPSTRYMGSKSKLLNEIWNTVSQFEYDTVIDLFSGSGIVSYLFKSQGKRVLSNDYMHLSHIYTKALIENSHIKLDLLEAKGLMEDYQKSDKFVETTFQGLYFSNDENILIDNIRQNISLLNDPYKKAIALSAIIRACFKKRPRGIFTYTGHRYDDGRKDITTSLAEHFTNAVKTINEAIFDNTLHNKSFNMDAMDFKSETNALVYMDPPYYSPYSDNEYVRRYHFVEGLARDWKNIEIQQHTTTKKFKSYPTPFSSKIGASEAFDKLFKKFKENIILLSYSSNSLPTQEEIISLLAKYKSHVEVIPIDYKYSFGNQKNRVGRNKNDVKEYLFLGY